MNNQTPEQQFLQLRNQIQQETTIAVIEQLILSVLFNPDLTDLEKDHAVTSMVQIAKNKYDFFGPEITYDYHTHKFIFQPKTTKE